jgi:ABC-2 type transport system permease protein
MSAFLAFEWLKLSKRMLPRAIVALLFGLTVLAFWGEAAQASRWGNLFLPRGWLSALTFCAFFAPFFWPVLGGSWAGNEYDWGTIRTILTRRPQRMAQVLAALLVLLIGVAVALVAMLLAGTVAGILVALATGNPVFTPHLWDAGFLATMARGFLTAWYVSAFYLVLAYAAATLFRSAAVGVGAGIGVTLAQVVLSRIFLSLGGVWQSIPRRFPFEYSNSMITRVVGAHMVPGTALAAVDPTTPGVGQALLGLGIYGALCVVVTLATVHRRDVTA